MAFYITTPLYYVNDLPHIGSAYPTMVTDFIAGHMMQRGEQVAFLTGTDEHGQKIEKAAAANGKTPQEHCDFIASEFKSLWDKLEISFDYFRRTSDDDHKNFVRDFYTKVEAKGDIYKGKYFGKYCVSCEDFKLEKDCEEVDGELHCPIHKQPLEDYEQENYFFKLSAYQEPLMKYIEENPDFISPEYRKNEVLGWIKEGLKDFPISRVGLEWGIDIPGDNDGQKIYVWFDALLGYLSGLGSDVDKSWEEGSTMINIIGKDILRFHAVYWPAMLMSAGYPLPSKVFGHGFLTKDGMKMGKTLGNTIDPVDLADRFGADAVRFHFIKEMIFGRDGDFTESSMVEGLNADLANNLGNLLNRSCNLIKKYFDFKIPDAPVDAEIAKIFTELEINFKNNVDAIKPSDALSELFLALNKVNAYINEVAPWKLLKVPKDQPDAKPSEENVALAASSLVSSIYACRSAAFLLAPIAPGLAKKILVQLGEANANELDVLDRRALMSGPFAFENYSKSLEGSKDRRINSEIKPIFERLEVAVAV